MRRTTVAALALAGALVAGGGALPAAATAVRGPAASRAGSAPKARSAPAGRHAAPSEGSGFPVTVAAANGAVRIATRPTRILSLSASATQMLYEIGAGRQVVGVDKYSTWPPNAPRTSFTGGESSAEGYLPLHPDLVLLAYQTGHLLGQLAKLHIPALLLPAPTTVAGTERQLGELGRATGHLGGARSTITALNEDLTRAVRSAGARGHGATYYLELDQTYYSTTSRTFIGSVLHRFGMVDIADAASHASSGYPQLSAEYVLAANPDYVFLADTVCCGQSPKTFASRPGFASLRAVRLGHVIGLNDSVVSQWGPHSLEAFVAAIAGVLGETAKARAAARRTT